MTIIPADDPEMRAKLDRLRQEARDEALNRELEKLAGINNDVSPRKAVPEFNFETDFRIINPQFARGSNGVLALAEDLTRTETNYRGETTHPLVVIKPIMPYVPPRGLDSVVEIELIRTEQKRADTEANAIFDINRPNIARLVGRTKMKTAFGEQEGHIFEYEGEPASEAINAGRKFSPPEVRHIIEQIGDALHYIKTEKNRTHRDVKPSSILLRGLGPAWTPVLGDFTESVKGDQTRTGTVAGTGAYAPEEQLRYHEYNNTTDPFTLARSAGEMILGTGSAYKSWIAREKTLRDLLPNFEEPKLLGVLEKMTSYKVEDRYANIDELLAAVEKTKIVAKSSLVPRPDGANNLFTKIIEEGDCTNSREPQSTQRYIRAPDGSELPLTNAKHYRLSVYHAIKAIKEETEATCDKYLLPNALKEEAVALRIAAHVDEVIKSNHSYSRIIDKVVRGEKLSDLKQKSGDSKKWVSLLGNRISPHFGPGIPEERNISELEALLAPAIEYLNGKPTTLVVGSQANPAPEHVSYPTKPLSEMSLLDQYRVMKKREQELTTDKHTFPPSRFQPFPITYHSDKPDLDPALRNYAAKQFARLLVANEDNRYVNLLLHGYNGQAIMSEGSASVDPRAREKHQNELEAVLPLLVSNAKQKRHARIIKAAYVTGLLGTAAGLIAGITTEHKWLIAPAAMLGATYSRMAIDSGEGLIADFTRSALEMLNKRRAKKEIRELSDAVHGAGEFMQYGRNEQDNLALVTALNKLHASYATRQEREAGYESFNMQAMEGFE